MANHQHGNGRHPRDDERLAARDRERMGAHWDDRGERSDDREDRNRSTEYYGQGQSGYAAGRERPVPQTSYGSDGNTRQVGYGYLGQSGQQMGNDDRDGLYGQGGYNEGMYGQGGVQNRYGSQGYQGWGQQHGAQPRGGMSPSPGHRGKGPSGYTRSDDRIRESVCEALMEDDHVDATHIDVSVKNGEVTLSGTVEDRGQKRMAEDCIENLAGVKDVVNQLRIGSGTGHGDTQISSDKRHRA